MKVQVLLAALAVFIVPALTAPLASAAAHNGNKAEGNGTPSNEVQAEQARSDHPRFNREALDINVYGLAYHPDRKIGA